MDPYMWQNAWEHVCSENMFLVMKNNEADQESGQCPYCTLCSKWAEVPHLLSDKCIQKRRSNGYAQDGPLLAAILKAEQQSTNLPQYPKPQTPGLLPPGGINLKASFGHATGVCPKEGCGLRAGCRSSRTHCCRRCEMEHLHGKPRLDRDPGPGPTTGEVWKKAHGPECTGHVDRKMRPPVVSRQHSQYMTVMQTVPEAARVPPPPPPYPPEYGPMHPQMNSSGGHGGHLPYYNSGGYADSSSNNHPQMMESSYWSWHWNCNEGTQNYHSHRSAQYPSQ